jgi:hypothetical protein
MAEFYKKNSLEVKPDNNGYSWLQYLLFLLMMMQLLYVFLKATMYNR